MGAEARRSGPPLVTRALTAAFVAAAVALSACSSDGGSGNDTLTVDELVAEGNQICRDAQARLDPQGEEVFAGAQPDAEALAAFHTVVVADLEIQLAQFRELRPPSSLSDAYAGYLELAADAIEEVRSGGPDGLLSPANPFEAVNARAAALGFDACVP